MSGWTYGPRMAIEGFFNASAWPPVDQIGGWLVRGHDRAGQYQEFVVARSQPMDIVLNRTRGWIDWLRVPLEHGHALLDAPDALR